MNLIIENWYIAVGILAIVVGASVTVVRFMGLPTAEQVKKIKQWLLYAVSNAEKELGSGTGALKLRQVYDAFITKFPTAAKLISFETFSVWVDDALEEMRKLLETNAAIKAAVVGETEEAE